MIYDYHLKEEEKDILSKGKYIIKILKWSLLFFHMQKFTFLKNTHTQQLMYEEIRNNEKSKEQ